MGGLCIKQKESEESLRKAREGSEPIKTQQSKPEIVVKKDIKRKDR